MSLTFSKPQPRSRDRLTPISFYLWPVAFQTIGDTTVNGVSAELSPFVIGKGEKPY